MKKLLSIHDPNIGISDSTQCRECGEVFHHLGSHLTHRHHMLAKDYKAKWNLEYSLPLISPEVRLKKQIAFEQNREYYLANGMKNIEKYQYKPGENGGPKRMTPARRKRLVEQSQDITKKAPGICLVCRMKYDHLPSHLFSAHRMIQAK